MLPCPLKVAPKTVSFARIWDKQDDAFWKNPHMQFQFKMMSNPGQTSALFPASIGHFPLDDVSHWTRRRLG
jgi:hypothetical protein